MRDKEQELKAAFSEYTDEALREILYRRPADYEAYALAAAGAELQKRHESLFAESSRGCVPLKSVIRGVDFDEITEMVGRNIWKKSELPLYEKAFEKISGLESETTSQMILNVVRPGKKNGLPDISAQEPAGEEKTDAALLTWGEWLGAGVKEEQILEFGAERIAAASLIKMTTHGFDENGEEPCFAETEVCEAEGCETEDDLAGGDGEEYAPGYGGQADEGFLTRGILAYRASRQDKNGSGEYPESGESQASGETPQIRPWVRYWARAIDSICFTYAVYFTMRAASPHIFSIYQSVKYISLSAIIWIAVEAVLLATAGTTPGKWILRVTVRNDDETKLSFRKSLLRSVFVWACGNGFAITYLEFAVNIFSYFYLTKKGKTLWDEKLGVCVSHKKIGGLRVLLAALLLTLVPALLSLLVLWGK